MEKEVMMQNRLQFEKSPYLLQHKDNPVAWQVWGEEAFETARAEDKPIFLSIGYSTCHWCHVMAHESFEDEAVAAALNEGFVSIKVDREERPDIDAVYMAACQAMTGTGGWPLTVLLTHEQKPFWAGTYLPKKALLRLLGKARQLWREERESVLTASDELTAHLKKEEEARADAPTRELVTRAVGQFSSLFDPAWGGFGAAPKFPTPHNLLFLMRFARLEKDENAWKMAETTLESMVRGGLFDHVGGGFSRYSTDEKWLVPHFEKMLYDNALLSFSYAEAFAYSGRRLYETVTRRTLDYMLRELQSDEGGFYCGQDADSEGVEGKYYTFAPSEIYAAIGDEKEAFCRRYGVTERGNFEGKNILNLIGRENLDEAMEGMDELHEKLRRYRLERTVLHKDDKILTAWNGLAIAALAKAGQALREPRYIDAAERAAAFIREKLTDADGRLFARRRDGESAHSGKLDDYAFCAWGLLELYGTTLKVPYLLQAQRLADSLHSFFFDEENGGFYPYASDAEQLLTRTKEVYDGAMPSGNAVAALVFSRLYRLSGKTQWQKIAQRQLSYLTPRIARYPAGHSFTLLVLLEELWPAAELVCAGREQPKELMELLRAEPRLGLSVLCKTPENQDALAELAPFTAQYPFPERGVRYYLCKNGACERPVDSIGELRALW